jgi:hypothetical protein
MADEKPQANRNTGGNTGPFFPGEDVDSMFLNQLTAEAAEYIHDTAKDEVLEVLSNTDDTAATIAATTYKITRGLLERHKDVGLSLEADLSHALALGSEVTDMLVEIVEVTQPNAAFDPQRLREESLLRATVMHGEEVEKRDDPDEKDAARVMYTMMMQDGTVEQGMNYVNKRSSEMGLNTNDMLRRGVEGHRKQQNPKKDPLSAAVSNGVQGMAEPPPAAPPAEELPLMGGM